jgi:hypothetical protein
MKKINIIDAVAYFFASDSAGDQRGIYHPEIIKVHLNSVFNRAVYDTYQNGLKSSDYSQLDAWCKIYECAVTGQVAPGTTGYALLPFAPSQLPNNMGVRQVCDHNNNGNVFAPVENTSAVIFAELDVNTMDSTPTYNVQRSNVNVGAGEASTILRLSKLPITSLITALDVMMVVPLDQLDDFDEIAMPSAMEDDIIRQVIDLMGKRIPVPNLPSNVVNS